MSMDLLELPNGETGIRFMGVATISLERLALRNALLDQARPSPRRTIFMRDAAAFINQGGETRFLKPDSGRLMAMLGQSPPGRYRPPDLAKRMSETFDILPYKADNRIKPAIAELDRDGMMSIVKTKHKNQLKYSYYKYGYVELTAGLLVPEGFDDAPIADSVEVSKRFNFSLDGIVIHDGVANLRSKES